ncbi:MAG: hypothetical protein R6X12_08140 [bacterium]
MFAVIALLAASALAVDAEAVAVDAGAKQLPPAVQADEGRPEQKPDAPKAVSRAPEQAQPAAGPTHAPVLNTIYSFSAVPRPKPQPEVPREIAYRPPPPPPAGRGGRGGARPPRNPPRGRRGPWRWSRYHWHGSWSFLIYTGPVVYHTPRSASVVRLPRRDGVFVRHTGDDPLGATFATSVRERLRERGIRVTGADKAALELYLVSMEEDPEDPGWGSAVSVSYISEPGQRFITAQMIDVGHEQVDELARLVADYVDELADSYFR